VATDEPASTGGVELPRLHRPARRRASTLTGGGTAGNEQLTAMVGVLLIVLLAVIGVTILRIRQLISVHLFVGLLLLGPVALKMASTGYRFLRYYTGNLAYRSKGPPLLVMRLIAPMVVFSTVAVFATGIVLMALGPRGRQPYLLLHKASFIVWIVFTALHVLGHLPDLVPALRGARSGSDLELASRSAGAAGRWILVAGVLVGGAVLAIVLIPDFASWTGPRALAHHHG
jgi:hypothetical protein